VTDRKVKPSGSIFDVTNPKEVGQEPLIVLAR